LGGLAGFMLLAFLKPIQDNGPPEELSLGRPDALAPDSTPESDVALA
jgi:hypothetical protein